LGKNAKISQENIRNSMKPRGCSSVVKVRNEGLNVDVVLQDGNVTGFTIDYQHVRNIRELKKWINIVDEITFRPYLDTKDAVPPSPASAPDSPALLPLLVEEPVEMPEGEPVEEPVKPVEEPVRPAELPAELPVVEPVQEPVEMPEGEPVEEPVKPVEEPVRPAELPAEMPVEMPVGPVQEPVEMPAEGLPGVGDYRKIVLRAVDTSLDIIGKDGKQVLLSLLENRYGLIEEEIPEHPRAFIDLLEEDLGSSAYAIEKEITREIRKISSVQAENLYKVVELLKEKYPAKTQASNSDASNVSIKEDVSPTLRALEEKNEKPAEEAIQEPNPPETPIPADSGMKDPIPVGFKYSASFSSHVKKGRA
jgi:hypothetical protein